MLFRIKFTSVLLSKPCKNAVKKGSRWFVEIATIEALMDLIKEVGYDIIMSEDLMIIYDDYLE